MNNKNLLLIIALFTSLLLLSYRITHALFSDSATSSNNVFTASSDFGQQEGGAAPIEEISTPTPTPTPKVLINEVFPSGTNSLEWVELYNPNSIAVDVSGWKIEDGNSSDTLPSSSPISGFSYAVIVADNTISVPSGVLKIIINDIGSGLNASGDLVKLSNASNTPIDEMSYGNYTPSVFTDPLPTPANGHSLARIPNGTDNDISSDWQLDSSPTVGEENNL